MSVYTICVNSISTYNVYRCPALLAASQVLKLSSTGSRPVKAAVMHLVE